MENAINEPVKKNYDFIDHIRCISMMSIVIEHTTSAYLTKPSDANYIPYLLIMQLFKFGTIIFFLLAGFLISEKFTDYTPGQYLKRRFSTTFGPWVIWSFIYLFCFVIHMRVMERLYHRQMLTVPAVLHEIRNVYLFTNYWFIINFMVSITLLLIFKRHLYKYGFGFILTLFTLFYSVNIHFEWINPTHTIAILGFVFFLWLGAQLRRHWLIIEYQIKLVPYWLPIFAVLITFGLSIAEAFWLNKEHSIDSLNTLRFSNILFSLACFALFLKIGTFKLLNHFKPRQSTYGIYLIHYILVIFLVPEILHPLGVNMERLSGLGFVLTKLMAFLIVYAISLTVVLLINKTRFKRIVGN